MLPPSPKLTCVQNLRQTFQLDNHTSLPNPKKFQTSSGLCTLLHLYLSIPIRLQADRLLSCNQLVGGGGRWNLAAPYIRYSLGLCDLPLTICALSLRWNVCPDMTDSEQALLNGMHFMVWTEREWGNYATFEGPSCLHKPIGCRCTLCNVALSLSLSLSPSKIDQ